MVYSLCIPHLNLLIHPEEEQERFLIFDRFAPVPFRMEVKKNTSFPSSLEGYLPFGKEVPVQTVVTIRKDYLQTNLLSYSNNE